jgi:putative transposase
VSALRCATALQDLADSPARMVYGEAFVVRCEAPLFILRLAGNRAFNTMNHMLHRPAPWPHAPTHQLSQAGTYFVTAGTYRKAHHFGTSERLDVLQRGLLKLAAEYGWHLEAWAVFSNHYHFVAHSPEQGADNLSEMLNLLHQKTAAWLNKLDATRGRQVWFNFHESRLTYQKSYFTRLNYVHQNAVKHGLVPVANQYRWCSAAWFERSATPAQVKSIYRFKTDHARVFDEFEPVGEQCNI